MKKKRFVNKDSGFGSRMILPAFLLICIFMMVPFVQGLAYSFTNYKFNRPGQMDFVFLDNFIKILTSDGKFWGSLWFTIVYAVSVVVISYVAGFGIALLLNMDIPFRGLFRSLILIPWIISSSVAATNWKWLLNERYGLINQVLQALHLVDSPVLFLSDTSIVRSVVIFIGAWKQLPFMTIVILAGLQSVSGSLYEAAEIDGAGFWKKLWYITIPSIRSVSTMAISLMFFWMLNNFENIYLMTYGGPNKTTYTLPIYIYDTAIGRNNISYAAAVAVLILLIMVAYTAVRSFLDKRREGAEQ